MKRFKTGAVLVSLLLTIILSGVMIGIADDAPPPPNKFYGNVSLNGEPAPVGIVINAHIDGELRGSVEVTTHGRYGDNLNYLVVNGSAADDGKMIEFYVNCVRANETAVWYSMAPPRKLDLSVEGVCGDINGDMVVDIDDVHLLLEDVGNHGDYEAIADVNCDGSVNMGDVILLLNHVNNPEIYRLTCCEET